MEAEVTLEEGERAGGVAQARRGHPDLSGTHTANS